MDQQGYKNRHAVFLQIWGGIYSHHKLNKSISSNVVEGNKKYKKFWKEVVAYIISLHTDIMIRTDHIENDAFSKPSIVAFVFNAAGMCLSSRCLATIGDIQTQMGMQG